MALSQDYLFGADWHLGFVHMLRLSSPLTYEVLELV